MEDVRFYLSNVTVGFGLYDRQTVINRMLVLGSLSVVFYCFMVLMVIKKRRMQSNIYVIFE